MPVIDFRAKATDVCFNNISFWIEVEFEYRLEEHPTGNHATFAAKQDLEQSELAGPQINELAAAPNHAFDEIHFEVSGSQQGGRRPQCRSPSERD
jgi:hypothetical protein